MVKNKKLLISYKLFFGMLGLSGVATEIIVLIYRGTFVPGNFFSFFTIQSNVFASVLLLVGAALLLKRKGLYACDMWRGAAVLYMSVTGIIFAILLSGLDTGVLTAIPWDNTVLHYIMPLAVFGDWLIDTPKRRILFRQAIVWLAYPIVYLLYTLIRGHFAAWYPYPFLDVSEKGYIAVLSASVVVAAVVAGLAWLMSRISRAGLRPNSPKDG
jgi:hypothetical protein